MKTLTKKGWFIFGLIAVFLFGGVYVYQTWQTHRGHGHETLEEFYTCPMHPEVIRDKPGNCPICGMRLVKKKRTEESKQKPLDSEIETLAVSPLKQVLANVAVEPVQKRVLTKTVQTVALVAFDRELFTAAQEYVSALSASAKAKDSGFETITQQSDRLVAAAHSKLELLGFSPEEIAGLRKTGRADTALYFPKEGGDVWLNATIYEFEREWVRPGTAVEITVDAYPGEVFRGEVASVTPLAEFPTRAFKARIRMERPARRLDAQMFGGAKIQVALGEFLAVPVSAVVHTGTRQAVWVQTAQDRFMPRKVTLGTRADDYFVVMDGLQEGERVVAQGGFLIDSEAELRSFGGGGMKETKEVKEMKGHQH